MTMPMSKKCGMLAKGESNVPWLRLDMSALPPQGPGYGAAIAEKIKACLGRLVKDVKMKEDGVVPLLTETSRKAGNISNE